MFTLSGSVGEPFLRQTLVSAVLTNTRIWRLLSIVLIVIDRPCTVFPT